MRQAIARGVVILLMTGWSAPATSAPRGPAEPPPPVGPERLDALPRDRAPGLNVATRATATLPQRASRRPLPGAAPSQGRIGAWINQGHGVTGVYSGHDVQADVDLRGRTSYEALYAPTLVAPEACVESTTAHWRPVGGAMNHGHGFWNACSGGWLWFGFLDAAFRNRYVRTFDNEERLFTEVLVSGGRSWGLLYDFSLESWVTIVVVDGTRSSPGWAQFEPQDLEFAGCPPVPAIRSRSIQVNRESTWAPLQSPVASELKIGPCSAAYYRAQYESGFSDWQVTPFTPTWPMPFAGGESRTVTCLPGDGADFGCSHTDGQNRDAYDFAATFGSDFVASRAGTVVQVVNGFSDTGGRRGEENYVFIRHADGRHSLYVHHKQNSAYVTTAGQAVKAGERLAQIGTSGQSSGPHLHFVVNTGFCSGVFCDSVPIQFDDIAPARGASVVSDNWPQP